MNKQESTRTVQTSSRSPLAIFTLIISHISCRGVARNLFWGYTSFWGWIKLLNSRSDVILLHKKFTWADFGGINTNIHPRRYAPDFMPTLFMAAHYLSDCQIRWTYPVLYLEIWKGGAQGIHFKCTYSKVLQIWRDCFTLNISTLFSPPKKRMCGGRCNGPLNMHLKTS